MSFATVVVVTAILADAIVADVIAVYFILNIHTFLFEFFGKKFVQRLKKCEFKIKQQNIYGFLKNNQKKNDF